MIKDQSSSDDFICRPEFERHLDKFDAIEKQLCQHALLISQNSADTQSLKTQISDGFDKIHAEIQTLKSMRTWVISGIAAGGSAFGAAIWHAIQLKLIP
ncbi:hypothetical protein [Swingsia samuiensis]|uniref:Uncharacterized protein n=1 Tax=Swingsia samuiensis TaxID=1293412 RepID=A0A4Y6UJN2_9PROT|nr:hypothetical protein [Swingsia samuiensis]QDH16601.1 hypothetical protein E3D00_02700 [Swingsia samuiensis]